MNNNVSQPKQINHVERPVAESLTTPIAVKGHELDALVDTGADTTCIDEALAKYLEIEIEPPVVQNVRGAGQPITIKGTANILYEYEDVDGLYHEVELKTTVLENLDYPIMLGVDFGLLTSMKINFKEKQVELQRPNYTTNEIEGYRLRTEEGTHIPGRTMALIRTKVPEEMSDREGHVVPEHNIENIAVGNALVKLKESTTPIMIMNLSKSTTYIPANTPVATFEEVAELQTESYPEKEITRITYDDDHELATLCEDYKVQMGKNLSEEEKQALRKLLTEYQYLFSFDKMKLGLCNVMEHEIDTGDAKPIARKPYRLSQPQQEEVNKQIKEMLEMDVIEPAFSPWASPIIVVNKKDGGFRCCVDLRAVNKVTKLDKYPLPNIDESLNYLHGCKYITTLDLNNGYHQIKMKDSDKEKTAFVSQAGLYQFKRMCFGLTNAPSTFQRTMDIVLSGLKWNILLVYLDDVIIFSKTMEEHLHRLREVFERFSKHNLTLKPSKCVFAVNRIHFLGYIVAEDGIHMDPDKINAVQHIERPHSVTDIRSFIGCCSYYRKFIQNFAAIAEPLTRLTKKAEPFIWGTAQQEAFDTLKRKMTEEPVLTHFDPGKPIELRTDACGYGLGAILLHKLEEGNRVISYASRLLNPAERNYSITEQECLAVVWAMEKFRSYIIGQEIVVVTDHCALCWLYAKDKLPPRLVRWALQLQSYDFKIQYKSGVMHKDADCLSRYPDKEAPQEMVPLKTTFINRVSSTSDDMLEDQAEDAFIKSVRDKLSKATSMTGREHAELRQYVIYKDHLYKQLWTKDGPRLAVVVPEKQRITVLKIMHDDVLAGHLGFRKTFHRLAARYYWPDMRGETKRYVQSCQLCQKRKSGSRKKGLMHPIRTGNPFDMIGMDTVGPFKRSLAGNTKAVVILDYATKYAITAAIPKENSEEIAKVLVEKVFCIYGAPKSILTDQAKTFSTGLINAIYKEMKTKHLTTTGYHPQTNGLTERFNRTLNMMLSMYVNAQHNDWDTLLPYVTFAYNSTVQDSTGYTPYFLMYGKDPILPSDSDLPSTETETSNFLNKLKEARDTAKKAVEKAQKKQKDGYDQTHNNIEYQVGDYVMLYKPRPQVDKSKRFLHYYVGPYKILQKLSPINYQVTHATKIRPTGSEDLTETVHISRLKPYYKRVSAIPTSTNIRRLRVLLSTILCLTIVKEAEPYDNPKYRPEKPFSVIYRRSKYRIYEESHNEFVYLNYYSPCEGTTSIFRVDPSKRIQTTHNFETWCSQFTNTIIEKGLASFCQRNNTNLDVVAPKLNHRYTSYSTQHLLKNNSSLNPGLAPLPWQDVDEVRTSRREKRSPSRRPKIWPILWFGVGAGVGFLGSVIFGIGSNVGNTSEVTESKVNELVEANKDTLEVAELLKGVADKYLENAAKNSEIIKNMGHHLRDLNITADPRTQAIMSSLVFRFLTLEQELKTIADSWNTKKQVHPTFFDAFQFQRSCHYTCPTDLTKVISCSFNPIARQIIAVWRQTIIKPFNILEADPFEFKYEIKGHLCKVPYIGPKYVIRDGEDCLKALIPSNIVEDLVVPMTGTDCIEETRTWGEPQCTKNNNIQPSDFNEVKLVNDHIYFRCSGEYVDNDYIKPCPKLKSAGVAVVPMSHNLSFGGLSFQAIDTSETIDTNFGFDKENLPWPADPVLKFNITDLDAEIEELKRFKNDTDWRYTKLKEKFKTRIRNFAKNPIKETGSLFKSLGKGVSNIASEIWSWIRSIFSNIWSAILAIIIIILLFRYCYSEDSNPDQVIINSGVPLSNLGRQ